MTAGASADSEVFAVCVFCAVCGSFEVVRQPERDAVTVAVIKVIAKWRQSRPGRCCIGKIRAE